MIVGDPTLTGRIAANRRRAVVLVTANAAVAGVVVGLLCLLVIAPPVALTVAVLVGAAVGVSLWWGSEPFARRLIRAHPADPVKDARFVNLVEGLCLTAGLSPPTLYVVDDAGLNALAVGRDPKRASLVVTRGLLDRLDRIELEALLAHELSHIKLDDTLPATIAVGLVGLLGGGTVALSSDGGLRTFLGYLLLPVSALAGLGMHYAVGAHREEVADLSGVSLTRYPPAMIAALEKLERDGTAIGRTSMATAHLWLGPPSPTRPPARIGWLGRLFETHPPLDERIEALREL